MWRSKLLGWAIALALIGCFSAISIAAEFSADLLLEQAGETVTGKVYVKGDKIRQEYIQRGTKQAMIFRFDKEMFWLLMPAEKVYMDISNNEGALASDPTLDQKIKDTAVQKYLGKETVNGYTCEKYQYIYNDTSRGIVTQWYSKKLNYPLKTEYKSPSGYMLTEYKNMKEGRVSDSLFDVPGDYMKMSLPGMR
jgi:outer membrane lipoprotein-sorting protein